jgi:carboxymethylenebutenolidase
MISTPSSEHPAGNTGTYVDLAVSDGTTMRAYVARPTHPPQVHDQKTPGIMVFQEAFGVNAHIRDVTERFARQGFVAIAPELFHRTQPGFEGSYTDFSTVQPHMQAMTIPGQEADVQATYNWLTADPDTDGQRIACIGFCMGGRISFLANTIVPVKAAISFYGSGIAKQLGDRASRLHAPQLLCWGDKDTHIPPEDRQAVNQLIRDAGKRFVCAEFGDADHGFFCDQRSAYEPHAAAQAWALTLTFIRDNLPARQL